MALVYFGIGTNLGDKKKNIDSCLILIKEKIGPIKSVSSIYETKPWGVENQDNYFNIVTEVETALFPLELLKTTQTIENDLGRVRAEKWGSRIIDIDILFYDNYDFAMHNLIIPHPYIAKRNFVLEPFIEINPDFIHPKLRLSVKNIQAICEDHNWIKRKEF